MPSNLHEALVEMVRQQPLLVAELLGGALGVDLRGVDRAAVESAEFADLAPAQYRADAVVVLTGAGKPVLAVVVEVQLRPDERKRWSWPVYLANLRGRVRCPAALLVVCLDAATATWCAAPIELGPGTTLCPLVLGPDRVPVVTDVDEAARIPELAVLSAMAHGADPGRRGVLEAVLSAFEVVDDERADLYCDVVLAALPEAAQRYLEELMTARTYEYRSDFARRYFTAGKAEGKAEGEAGAVLAVLDARGVEVPADARARITGCSDLDQLTTWVRRAATADSIRDLFGQS